MNYWTRIARSALGLILFFALWEGLCRFGFFNIALVPPPSHIPSVWWEEIKSGQWWSTLICSLHHFSIGLISGTILGILFGIWVALSPSFRAWQEWIVRLLRPVPPPAWIPFAIIWFGVSSAAAAFMIGIGVFWLNYFATLSAVSSIERNYFELAEVYGHKKFWARLSKIILPGAAPGILSGMRSGIGQGWMLVVAAELFGIPGVGQRMMEASGLLATDVVIVYMCTIALVYSLMDWTFVLIERRILRWQE